MSVATTLIILGSGGGCTARTDPQSLPELAVRTAGQPSAAPVRYGNMVLVVTTAGGAAAVDFFEPIKHGAEVKYRYRFLAADLGPETSGEGEVAERWEAVPSPATRPVGNRAGRRVSQITVTHYRDAGSQTWVEAGGIRFEWSRRDASSGWIYFDPTTFNVRVARTGEFELLDLRRAIQRPESA